LIRKIFELLSQLLSLLLQQTFSSKPWGENPGVKLLFLLRPVLGEDRYSNLFLGWMQVTRAGATGYEPGHPVYRSSKAGGEIDGT
jgi:hypothetical protein